MKSFIAALRTLVLPFGATSGTRIVLDGVNGVIQVYNAADELIALIDEDGLWAIEADGSFVLMTNNGPFGADIQLQPNDVPGLTYDNGDVYATTFAGQDNVPVTVVSSPRITSPFVGDFARIYVLGEDDAFNPPMIDLRSTGPVRVLDGDFQASHDASIAEHLTVGDTVTVNGTDIGRGHIGGISSVGSSAATAGPNEAIVLTVGNTTYEANRAYSIVHRAQGQLSAVIANNLLSYQVRNGAALADPVLILLGRSPVVTTLATGVYQSGVFTPGVNAVTTPLALTMTVPAGANGTHVGQATFPRSVDIYDIGANTDYPNAPVLT
jgi:hypothetical protein